jgi:hypothetical protein
LIGEEFDRAGIPTSLVEDFFLNHANILDDVQVHAIFTIPISLVYSERANQLPCPSDRIHIVPDTPVFDRDHRDSRDGRAALREILTARVSPQLFGAGQMMRLVVASGGNVRDLFGLVGHAADSALLGGSNRGKIGKKDADGAIAEFRAFYERMLGVGPFDVAKLTYAEKAERLVAIYDQEPDAKIPDPVLHSLLNARAVQEFNGDRWFGVHPLVVDILRARGRLNAAEGERIPGGTR